MIFLIWIIVGSICGFLGGSIASSKGRSFAGWFAICFLTGLIGLLIVALISTENKPAAAPLLTENTNSGNTDIKRWTTLVELDPEIAEAAATARQHGGKTEAFLAEKYLTLNDKQYLNAALQKAIEANTAWNEKNQSEETSLSKILDVQMDHNSGSLHTKAGRSDFKRVASGYSVIDGPGTGQKFPNFDAMLAYFKARHDAEI